MTVGIQLDGTTVSAVLIGVAALLSYIVSQSSAKSREDRRRLRELTRRDIAWTRWAHRVMVWAASKGYDDLPDQPRVLVDSEDDHD